MFRFVSLWLVNTSSPVAQLHSIIHPIVSIKKNQRTSKCIHGYKIVDSDDERGAIYIYICTLSNSNSSLHSPLWFHNSKLIVWGSELRSFFSDICGRSQLEFFLTLTKWGGSTSFYPVCPRFFFLFILFFLLSLFFNLHLYSHFHFNTLTSTLREVPSSTPRHRNLFFGDFLVFWNFVVAVSRAPSHP